MNPGPCPACGEAENEITHLDESLYVVDCARLGCGLQGPPRRQKKLAIQAWNSIRARVLREAADRLERIRPTHSEYCCDCRHDWPGLLRGDADAAERGE